MASSGALKAQAETIATLMLAVAAGVFIGLGAMFASSIGAGSELGLGPTRLLMGMGFSVGLLFVVVLGAELFTGNNLMVTSLITHQVRFIGVARNWTLVYVGNFVGSIALVLLVFYSRWWEQGDMSFAAEAVSTANAKVNLGFVEAFLRGVLANILVCLAVWTAAAGRTVTDKMFGVHVADRCLRHRGVRAQHRQHVLHAGRSADLGRTRRYRSRRTRGRRRGAVSLGPGCLPT